MNFDSHWQFIKRLSRSEEAWAAAVITVCIYSLLLVIVACIKDLVK